jgi:hypothetical protein
MISDLGEFSQLSVFSTYKTMMPVNQAIRDIMAEEEETLEAEVVLEVEASIQTTTVEAVAV